jgi:hypothetical protein
MRADHTRLPPAGGFSLIETIVFIVGAALVGVLSVLSLTAARSADPIQIKQAVAIGESFIDEILSREYSNPTGYVGASTDPRSRFADVDDYSGYVATTTPGIYTRRGAPIPTGTSALAGLLALPYARPWVEAWREWLEPDGVAARDPGPRSYRTALEHYALSRDAALARATRWRHLGTAMDMLAGLGEADAPLSRRLTHARVLYEAGLAPRANDLLATVIPRLLEGEPELAEPFVVPCARYERIAPAGAVSDWLLAACFEQREIVNCLTGYLDPAASLRRLRQIRDLGYGDAHIAHRAALIVRRFDQRRVRFD